MAEPPHYLVEGDLSRAWARAFLAAMEPGVDEISPLCVSVRGLDESRMVEEPAIRQALEKALAAQGEFFVLHRGQHHLPEQSLEARARTRAVVRALREDAPHNQEG